MKLEEALTRANRVVEAIKAKRAPYHVLQVVLYGSTARGDPNPNDVDLYVQLDINSVPWEDRDQELFNSGKGGTGTKLRKALKSSQGERLSITFDFVPWEQHIRNFVRPEDVDKVAKENIAKLDPTLKTYARTKARIEKSAAKRRTKPFEWPPQGIVLYEVPSEK